jgi:hypothetical protein
MISSLHKSSLWDKISSPLFHLLLYQGFSKKWKKTKVLLPTDSTVNTSKISPGIPIIIYLIAAFYILRKIQMLFLVNGYS